MPKRLTQSEFESNARNIHGDRYEYGVYNRSMQKMWICCKEHGWFAQLANDHMSGRGCPCCAGVVKYTQTSFELKANEVHSNFYTYGTYAGIKVEIEVICPIHGSFQQNAGAHIHAKHGCPKCSGGIISQVAFELKANEVHNNFYTYGVYSGATNEIDIICPVHGSFKRTADAHIQGARCEQCRYMESYHRFLYNAQRVHGDRYEYGEYFGAKQNMEILCSVHGAFPQNPNDHLGGAGCPHCCTNGYSSAQLRWLDYIAGNENITIQHKVNGGEYIVHGVGRVDGYCAATNTIYEFHGDYWHGHPSIYNPAHTNPTIKRSYGELYEKTMERDQKIRANGFNLAVIWGHEWKLIERQIKKEQKCQRN